MYLGIVEEANIFLNQDKNPCNDYDSSDEHSNYNLFYNCCRDKIFDETRSRTYCTIAIFKEFANGFEDAKECQGLSFMINKI